MKLHFDHIHMNFIYTMIIKIKTKINYKKATCFQVAFFLTNDKCTRFLYKEKQ